MDTILAGAAGDAIYVGDARRAPFATASSRLTGAGP
jgi:hypothetical protein